MITNPPTMTPIVSIRPIKTVISIGARIGRRVLTLGRANGCSFEPVSFVVPGPCDSGTIRRLLDDMLGNVPVVFTTQITFRGKVAFCKVMVRPILPAPAIGLHWLQRNNLKDGDLTYLE